jgi:hypothetical protein
MPETSLATANAPPAAPFADAPAAEERSEAAYEANAYVIEVRGQTAGIVARDGQGFRFHASAHRFNALDGRRFRTPREAEKAALKLIDPALRRRPPLPRRFALVLS